MSDDIKLLPIKRASGYAGLHRDMAIYYMRNSEYQKALFEFKISRDTGLPDYVYYEGIACIYESLGEYEKSLAALKKAEKAGCENELIHKGMGLCFAGMGRYEDAISQIKSAQEYAPEFGQYNAVLAGIYLAFEDFENCIKQCKKAIENGHKEDIVYKYMLIALSRTNDQKSFVSMLGACTGDVKADNIILESVAVLNLENHNYDAAANILRDVVIRNKDNEYYYKMLGYARILQYRYAGYVNYLKDRLDSGEEDGFWAAVELAWILMWEKNYNEAIDILEEKIEIFPKNIYLHIYLSYAYRKNREFNKAENILKKAGEFSADKGLYHLEYGKLLLQKEEYDSAIREFSKVTKIPNIDSRLIAGINGQIEGSKHKIRKNEDLKSIQGHIKKLEESYKNNFFWKNTCDDLQKICNDSSGIVSKMIAEAMLYCHIDWRYEFLDINEGKVLYIITRLLKPQIILETGTGVGCSASYFAKGLSVNGFGRLVTIDKDEETGFAVEKDLRKNVEFYRNTNIKNGIEDICKKYGKIDIFFHDSDHTYEHFMMELKTVLPYLHNDSIVIAHDFSKIMNTESAENNELTKIDESKKYYFSRLGVLRDVKKIRF